MTKRATWLPPISIVAITFMVVGIALYHPGSPYPLLPLAITGQLALLLLLVRALYYWPPLERWVKTMPVPHRIVAGLLLGGMMLGHFSLNGRAYFPFVVWAIFPQVHPVDPVTAREFLATRADGSKVRLIVEQQFPSIVQIDPVDAFDDPHYYPPGTTEQVARALAKMYNAHHADNPVRKVDLVVVAIHLHPSSNESRAEPSCELLQHFDLSSDHSN